MLQGQLKANIECYFSIPSSFSKNKKIEANAGALRPTKKPDVDNLAKIILDSLNGFAYQDDKQIVLCRVDKWYSENPRVEILIQEI